MKSSSSKKSQHTLPFSSTVGGTMGVGGGVERVLDDDGVVGANGVV